MTVQTRSMTNSSVNKNNSSKKIKVPKKEKTFRFVTNETPKPKPILITQAEFDKIKDGYILHTFGGYTKLKEDGEKFLVAACIPAINSSVDDYISVYREDKEKIYAVAPNEYYWGLKSVYSAGYQYVLMRFDEMNG